MESENIKNLRLSSSTGKTEISDKLRKIGDLRYALINKKEKRPFERKWDSENNYSAESARLQKHLASGGNYGILCGVRGLVVFDSDDEVRLTELGVIAKLPRTFMVRTGGGGTHRYYICSDLHKKIVLYDPNLLNDRIEPLHLGEIQSKGQQVVGPGSVHPNGNRYEVIDDVEIAKITKEELLKATKNLKTSKKKAKKPRKLYPEKRGHTVRRKLSIGDGIRIEDIALPDGDVQEREGRNGTEFAGAHPVHGSTTGKNFHINVDKNVWHCHRCSSGGGPLEFLAVKEGIILCSEAGPGSLKGEKYKRVLEIAKGMGYEIPEPRQPVGQFEAIEKRIISDILPENLPDDPVVVLKGPPRIGKTSWSVKQLIMAGSGVFITHNHSIASHALRIFEEQGGLRAVHLEGKNRPGMCRKEGKNCKECELYPNQHDDGHISYFELERRAEELLRKEKILTKDKVPYELCPYYTLKLAEKFAQYCFTVPHFLEGLKPRQLIVIDEDPTLSFFYSSSVELFRFKREKNEYKFVNTLGKALEQAPEIRMHIETKKNPKEKDKATLWSIDQFGGINDIIKTTMSGEYTPEECYEKIEEQLTQESKVTYDDKTIEKALKNLDECMDPTSDVNLKDYICSWFHIFRKKPIFVLTSGGSGYKSVHLIGDASKPVINMAWSSTSTKSVPKILIIGNTLAELFGKALGNAVVIEISKFKYARNFIVVPMDSGKEDTCRGTVKNQRLKIKKLIKAVAGSPDSKCRHPILALVGSKKHQDWLMRSLGGIVHASQEESEIGQQWNHQGGNVNIFYQNSTMSRGLDMDQYNVICVHDADFAQPFWSAAEEAGDENACAILNSIIMDETTNSVLRISPVPTGGELRPKVVVIPREDLWKVRYLDQQVLGGKQGGRTPDVENIARLIVEDNLTGTVQLRGSGNDTCKAEWEEAVKEGKVVQLFKCELDRIRMKGNYTEAELKNAMDKIFQVLRNRENGKWKLINENAITQTTFTDQPNDNENDKWDSIKTMKRKGFKCKNALMHLALERLYFEGTIDKRIINKKNYWKIK